jgi:hypothetical protein
MVWRESAAASSPVACGAAPPWAPLATRPILLFDDETTVAKLPVDLPNATGLLDLASGLANPFAGGLALLDLDHGGFAGRKAQGWVLSRTRFSAPLDPEHEVFQVDDACTGARFHLLYYDGFESGLDDWGWVSPPVP